MKRKTISANAQPAIASVSDNSITLDSSTYRTDANTKGWLDFYQLWPDSRVHLIHLR